MNLNFSSHKHLYCFYGLLNIGSGKLPYNSIINCKSTCELISLNAEKSFNSILNQICYFLEYSNNLTHTITEEITSCNYYNYYHYLLTSF